jgi:pseudouridine synthase
VHKKYVVVVDGKVDEQMLRTFVKGVHWEGERLKAERAHLLSATSSQSVVELELAEGKYREVRRMFESQARTVKRLVRVQIGKIKLGELKTGRWRTLTEVEIKSLLGAL